MAITNLQLKNAKPGMHADGNGLYLAVKEGGTKSWIFRYQLNGRRREMWLGSAAALPIVPARAEAARLRALVAAKIDPLEGSRRRAPRSAPRSSPRHVRLSPRARRSGRSPRSSSPLRSPAGGTLGTVSSGRTHSRRTPIQ